jgi:hypothetical protein
VTGYLSLRLKPAEVKRYVKESLDRAYPHRNFDGGVSVVPRDERGRKSAAWAATRYEILAYPVAMGAPLEPIAEVLRGLGLTGIHIRTP